MDAFEWHVVVETDGKRWVSAYITTNLNEGQLAWVADTERGPFDDAYDLVAWCRRHLGQAIVTAVR